MKCLSRQKSNQKLLHLNYLIEMSVFYNRIPCACSTFAAE